MSAAPRTVSRRTAVRLPFLRVDMLRHMASLSGLALGEVYTWGDNDEGQLGDGTTNAIQRPRLVAALQGKKINRVACGSAHTLAWSTSKPTNAGKLPTQVSHSRTFTTAWLAQERPSADEHERSTSTKTKVFRILCQVPMEYNHLQEIPIMALRNRLLLLHHISELFCPCIPMFDLEGRLGQTGHGPSVGFDTLRGILISQGKVGTLIEKAQTKKTFFQSRVCQSHICFICTSRRRLSGKWSRPPWCGTDSTDRWWSLTGFRCVKQLKGFPQFFIPTYLSC